MKVLRWLYNLVKITVVFFVIYACVFAVSTYAGWRTPNVLEWLRYTLECIGAIAILVFVWPWEQYRAGGK